MKMKTTDFSRHLSNFLTKYLPGERGMSKNSIIAYRDTFVLLLRYCKDVKGINIRKLTINMLTCELVVEFLNWIQMERNCSASTRNARLAAIRAFINYVEYADPSILAEGMRISSIPLKKAEKKAISYLSVEGIKLLLKQPNLRKRSGRRDLALLSLMYDTGARVQEIADLTVGSVRKSSPYTIRIIGKGNKTRIVPLLEKQTKHLFRYMQEEGLISSNNENAPLFSNKSNGKLTRSGISYILSKYINKARDECPHLIPENISCHSLRHSKAMHMLQADVPLVYIRDILGHESVVTTEIYAKVDSLKKREVIAKAFSPTIEEPNTPIWLKDADLLEWLKSL
jgi:site-specific recombinase XerD